MLETDSSKLFQRSYDSSINIDGVFDPAVAGQLAYPIGKLGPIFSYLLQLYPFFPRIGILLWKQFRKFEVLNSDLPFSPFNMDCYAYFRLPDFLLRSLAQDCPALTGAGSWRYPSFSPTPWDFLLYAQVTALLHIEKDCPL